MKKKKTQLGGNQKQEVKNKNVQPAEMDTGKTQIANQQEVQEDGILQKKAIPYETILLCALSFLIPVLVMLLILKSRGFYPFGDKTLFIMDMRDQYLEFFASLRNVAFGDDSLFFSWSRSMGGNYLGLFAYYVASPLSFITIFFPLKKLTSAIVLLTLLKIGLAGLSFSCFARYIWKHSVVLSRDSKTKTEDSANGGRNWKLLIVLPFAISYALISYNMVYSLCLMWLDGVILLPLILLGVEKILDGHRGIHYMIALAALFICNYYTGYMVGVFTAIYTVYRVVCKVEKKNVKEYFFKMLRFAATTLLAFAVSAPLILPVVKDLMQGKLATASYMPDTKTNFIFSALFGKLKNGVYDSITNSGLPAIYCGYLVLLLAVVFFVLRHISIKEKAGAVLILVLLACSFYFTKWDIAWHGFQYPNWFPYRYAFVFSFFLLYMALRGACGICCLAKVSSCKKEILYAAAGILSVIVAVDLGVNGNAMFTGLESEFGYVQVANYEAFLNKTQPLVDQVKEQDKGFYRMNQGYEYSKNDAMLLGYHGLTHYSSTFHAAVNSLTPRLGIAQAHIWNSGYGSNPMLDSLFAVKYILDDGFVPGDYSPVSSSDGGASVYENKNVLPIAYGAPCADLNPPLDSADPFINQNEFLNAIAGTDQAYFTEFEYTNDQSDGGGWGYTFTADSTNPVYLYMKSDNTSWADVYVNDVWVGNYFSTETSCSLYLGNFQPQQQIVVKVVPSGDIAVNYAMIAQLHMDLLQQTTDRLKTNGMKIEKHQGGKLSGKITVDSQQKVITSIPYDSGWSVKIDGRKADTTKYADTFLAIEAESGEHNISFSYVSPGFGMGMVLFAVGILLSVAYFIPVGTVKTKFRKK